MITKLGDEELSIGTCHPGQARVLVKRELAAWHEGKLLILLKPAWLQAQFEWRNPGEDRIEVSDSELSRRREWFLHIMGVLPVVLAEAGSTRLPEILALARDQWDSIAEALIELSTPPLGERSASVSDLSDTDAELDSWYDQDQDDGPLPFLTGTLWVQPHEHHILTTLDAVPRWYTGAGLYSASLDQTPDDITPVRFSNR
jgi:hypothetical protein